MQVQRFASTAQTSGNFRSRNSNPAQEAASQDLVQIGSDRREMGLGRSIATLFGGGIGAAAGTIGGTIAGVHYMGGVMGGIGGGVAGLVVGGAIGALIGNKSYNSSGDWI